MPSPPDPGLGQPPPGAVGDEADAHLIERRIGGQTLLGGGFLEVRKDVVQLPDGQQATREFIQHSGAVAVVPVLDDGRLVLVRQFRYPVGRVLLELPAGKRDAGESTLACAMRELQEETGYTALEWAYGGEIHNAPAYSSESIWIWFARGLVAGPQRLDAGEFVEVVTLDSRDLDALEARDPLTDVKTIIALQWLQRWRSGERQLTWMSVEQATAL